MAQDKTDGDGCLSELQFASIAIKTARIAEQHLAVNAECCSSCYLDLRLSAAAVLISSALRCYITHETQAAQLQRVLNAVRVSIPSFSEVDLVLVPRSRN